MGVSTDKLISLIEAGASVEVSAEDRSSENLIRIAQAIAARGDTPKLLNCGQISTDNLAKIHHTLGGNVIFSGV